MYPCYNLRLTTPQRWSLVKIPKNNGDYGPRWFCPGKLYCLEIWTCVPKTKRWKSMIKHEPCEMVVWQKVGSGSWISSHQLSQNMSAGMLPFAKGKDLTVPLSCQLLTLSCTIPTIFSIYETINVLVSNRKTVLKYFKYIFSEMKKRDLKAGWGRGVIK